MAEIVSDLAEFHSRQASENAAAPPSAVELLNFTEKPLSKKPGGTSQGSIAKLFAGYCCVLLLLSGEEENIHDQRGIRCLKLNLRHQPQPRRADNVLPIFTIVRVQVHKQYDSHLKLTSIYIM